MPLPVSLTASITTWPTLAVAMVRRPPCGIASRALTTRFMITCPIWCGLALTRLRPESSRVRSSMLSPSRGWSTRVTFPTSWFRSTGVGAGGGRRLPARICWARAAPHSVARLMASALRRSGSSGRRRLSIISVYPMMTASRLLKSCATLLACRRRLALSASASSSRARGSRADTAPPSDVIDGPRRRGRPAVRG